MCILTPFGARVHAPWALALRAAVSDRVGYDVQAVWSDDGIVLTLADGDEPPDASALTPAADEIEERLVEELPRSPLFATEFRENAARALLLPRRRPGQRTPLFAQRLRAEKRRARHPDELHDLLRQLGDLTVDQIRERSEADPEPWMRELEQGRRSVQVRVAGREAWIAVEDAELYRDALGVAPPAGVAEAFLALVERPLEALLERWARTHRPFGTDRVAERFGLVPEHARLFLLGLARAGKLLQGEFRPDAEGEEWCDPDVLRQIKRRTIAKLRGQVAPVSREVLGRFLPSWHRVAGAPPHDRLEDAIVQLEGMPLSYRELVRMILPARVRRFHAEQLDELGALGWLVWVGHSALRGDDGRIVLYRRRRVDRLLLPAIEEEAGFALDERHRRILDHLEARGASFHPEVVELLPEPLGPEAADALWDLVWAGLVTNDTFAALRALTSPRRFVRRDDAMRGASRARARGPSPRGAGHWCATWSGVLSRAPSGRPRGPRPCLTGTSWSPARPRRWRRSGAGSRVCTGSSAR